MNDAMLPDHAWIAAHIPHQGGMCLLDRVVSWDETTILCCAHSHRATDNPLRHEDSLGIANGIEYAAQAMAVHSALLADSGQVPAAGFLTSVRNVCWSRPRLDDIQEELQVRAERIAGNELNILYEFSLHCAGEHLLSGRAGILLDAGKQAKTISRSKNRSS